MHTDTSTDHAWFREHIAPFVAGGLSPSELARFGAHRAGCAECAAELENCVRVDRSMKEALQDDAPPAGLEDRLVATFRREAAVSVLPPVSARRESARRSLFIPRAAGVCAASVLLGVVWYVIGTPPVENHSTKVAVRTIKVTPAQPVTPRPSLDEVVNEKGKSHDSGTSDITVPPDILAKAELGDHFETINPDRPDTHSAMGNPDAHMFHPDTPPNSDSAAGGGGMNGLGMDDLIGVGGTPQKGTGGGWGGGNGTGTGVDSGSGHGSFGQRNGGGRKLMVKRHGGSRATEASVDKALEWLAMHQEADGHWDALKFGATEKPGDNTVTSLSLLAFLGAGHTEKVGSCKDNVRRAVDWLTRHKGDASDPSAEIASVLALSEAAGMSNVAETRKTAQSRLDDILKPDAGRFAWLNDRREKDLLGVGWAVMMLNSAKVAGLKVNPEIWEPVTRLFAKAETKANGVRHATFETGSAARNYTSRTCAAGNFARQFLGTKADEAQADSAALMDEFGTPEWDAEGKKVDFEYWYFGTICAFQAGGDAWKRWNEEMKKALVEKQSKDGDNAGSWEPLGFNAQTHGRVGQTALGALCLEVYYRCVRSQPEK